MHTSESIKNIAVSMTNAQKEIKGMTPDANNPFFKSNYITLDGILEYVRPILSKEGIWIFQEATGDGEYIEVKTRLVHSSGEYIETDSLKMKPTKNDPQQLGSCITYAKRYQLASLLGISSEVDDDGNKATHGDKTPQANSALSEKQVSRLIAIAKAAGIDLGKLKAQILKETGKRAIEELTKQEYDAYCERLEKAKNAVKE